VKRYLAAGGWVAIRQSRRRRRLDELDDWVRECFRQHSGNCDVVRQDLLREHGVTVSLRTVQRAVAPLRQALRAEARACLRFETPPGKQLQIDFGAITVPIGGTAVRVHLFVATLGLPRRWVVERTLAWLDRNRPWRRISRLRSPTPKRGFTSPQCSCSKDRGETATAGFVFLPFLG
jgi:transposase